MITNGPKHWPHQIEALRFIYKHKGSLLWVPMRAGKTRIGIDYIQNTGPGPDLIVCPEKVIKVWAAQFNEYLANPRHYLIRQLRDISIAERADCIRVDLDWCSKYNLDYIAIVNYDVIAEEPLAKELLKVDWSRLIFDEVHRLQAPGGKQSRYAAKLAKKVLQAKKESRAIGLSGTPGNPLGNPKKQEMREAGILDIYGVMRTLAPGLFAYNYQQFKSKYGVWNQFTPFPKIEGYQNQADFDQRLAQVCFHVTEADLSYSLPETIEQIIPVALPSSVQAGYDELEDQLITVFEEETMSAANALVKQLRLQQLTAGFYQPDNSDDVMSVHSVKFDTICDMVSDIPEDERILIFCQFKPEMDVLTERLKKIGRKVYHIRGGIDTSDDWKATPGAALIVQIQAGGEGLDLSQANYCFYCSLCHSLRAYQQSMKRPVKADKKHPIIYYYILAEKTIDYDIYEAQQAKEEVVDSVRKRLLARRKKPLIESF